MPSLRQERLKKILELQGKRDLIDAEIRRLTALLAVPEGFEEVESLVEMYFTTRPPGEIRQFRSDANRLLDILRTEFDVIAMVSLRGLLFSRGKPQRNNLPDTWRRVDPTGTAYNLFADIVEWAEL